jgi:hypothetical protein
MKSFLYYHCACLIAIFQGRQAVQYEAMVSLIIKDQFNCDETVKSPIRSHCECSEAISFFLTI